MLRAALLPILLSLLLAPTALAVPAGSTVLVDRPSGFGPLPFDGLHAATLGSHALTADGCAVVYSSSSDALLAGDEDSAYNVYLQDRCTPGASPVQVNVSATGEPAEPRSLSFDATVSANGRFVAFTTTAANLHPDARGAEEYVLVKDLQTGEVELASRGTGENGAPARNPDRAVISGDGRSVAFVTEGPLDALGDQDGVANESNAFLRSLVFDLTRIVSLTTDGKRGSGVEGYGNVIDLDHSGSNVIFVTEQGLAPGDTDGDEDVYLRRAIGTLGQMTELVSFTAGNTTGATSADEAAISGDGTRVAYTNDRVWVSQCTPCKPANRVDQPRPGGSDSGALDRSPSFPQTGAAAPSAVFWITTDPLDPADANGRDDVYGSLLSGGLDPVRSLTGGVSGGYMSGASATDNMDAAVFTAGLGAGLPASDGVQPQVFERVGGTVRNLAELAGIRPRTREAGDVDFNALHALSDDGRLAVFASDAAALGAPMANGYRRQTVLARDLTTGSTIPVSVGPGGVRANGDAYGASVDAAGRRVAFVSNATNLGTPVTGGWEHVYVRDLQTGAITLVDRAPNGNPASTGAKKAQISGDGTKVVFESDSPELPGGGGGIEHVYRADLATGEIVMVDRSSAGAAGDKDAGNPDIDHDGSRVAFASRATNLGGPANAQSEVYVRDLAAGTTAWASEPEAPTGTRPWAGYPSLSGDGDRVAFVVRGASFGHGATAAHRVFVRDLARRTTTLAAPGGGVEDWAPSLSRDGTKVAFARYGERTMATLVRDLEAGSVVRADRRHGTTEPGRLGGSIASLSANGACVLFQSDSDDVVSPAPGPDFEHAYLHALGGDCPVTPGGGPAPQGADTLAPVISGARVTNKRFRTARGRTARTARVKRGTAFVFTLSEPARTTIAIARKRGRRFVRVVSLARGRTRQGSNRVAFTGRVGRRRLARARYRAAIVATDAAGNRSRPAFVRFRVVR